MQSKDDQVESLNRNKWKGFVNCVMGGTCVYFIAQYNERMESAVVADAGIVKID